MHHPDLHLKTVSAATHLYQVCPAKKKDKDGNKTSEKALKMVANTEAFANAKSKNWKIFMAFPRWTTA